MAKQTRKLSLSAALVAIVALAAVFTAQVQSVHPLTDEANALRLAELENDLSSPTTLVELNSQQLQAIDTTAVISKHVQDKEQNEAHSYNDEAWKHMSEEQQRAEVDASLAEVEAAQSEERPVNAEASALLQTSSKAMSSAEYWNNAWHRRWWCNAVRWGYHWIERHPHWQNICRSIEQFRPWGWWSYMCHNIYSGNWGWWYRHNWWWRHQCESIRNPHYVSSKHAWRWHPQHRRHQYSSWCETHGHNYRDLNNGHYNHWCHGREAPKHYQRGLWDVDPKSSTAEQNNYWWCRAYRGHAESWKQNNGWAEFQNRCAQNEGARGAKYPGYDPNLTPEQRAAIIAKAKAAAEAARLKALRPRWVWSKEVPRTSHSKWCEEHGLDQADSAQYASHCEGNRESEADRLKRVAAAERRAKKRVLAQIPQDKPSAPAVKQIPVKPFTASPLVLKARAEAAAAKAEAKLSPEKKAAAAAKSARLAESAKANLPTGVKGGNMGALLGALNLASKIPAPKSKSKKKFKPMPAPPSLPPKPKTAPKLSELKKIAKAVAKAKAAVAVPKTTNSTAPAHAADAAPVAPQNASLPPVAKSTPPPPPPPPPAPKVARKAAAPAPPRALTLEEQWALEDARRRKARAARLAAEDAEDREEDRRRASERKKRIAARRAAKKAARAFNKGENKDWNAKFPNPHYDPKPARKWVNNHAAPGAPGCPRCKNKGLRKKWQIVLDPTSVAEIDRPLIEELHRRVNYLVEPVQKKLNIAQYVLDGAAKQVVDAEEHHVRVYDFGEKHKNQLLIPKYIQDEQKMVQL